MNRMLRPARTRGAIAGAAAVALALSLPGAALAAPPAPAPAHAVDGQLTNLAHLDFLLDEATPPADVEGHTTYRLAEQPVLVMPWTYADARPGGTFERVGGGGPPDPVTGHWKQGAYNADDISRAAVVYARHWEQTGDEASRDKAYELLRSLAYLQTIEGPNAGNVVLWMQPDGTLNPSAEPVELPDPSDSGPSYWLARTIWAFGEGHAAFADADPEFAAFLDERLALAIDAVDRQVLVRYGQWAEADGMRVPQWLIVDGADASAEAVLGLAAHVQAQPGDTAAAEALRKLAEGIAAMSAGDARSWPYGALLPWTPARSLWHAWGSQMPAAVAAASVALGDPSLVVPAVRDSASFTPTLMTAGGPDNGWMPTPTERVQIAYGADSRVQSLFAVADATGAPGFTELAVMQAAWFFGANHAGEPMYDPATGVTFDGLEADGRVNRNSGAESTIHGLLTMLALDARPGLGERASALTEVAAREGLRLVQAESGTTTGGTVTTPEAWTGESLWAGEALTLPRGASAVFDIGADSTRRWVEPVVWSTPGESSASVWRAGNVPLGVLHEEGPAQGVSPTPGVLWPRSLQHSALDDRSALRVDVLSGELVLDAILVRPVISRLALAGEDGRTELVHSSAAVPQPTRIGTEGTTTHVIVFDSRGGQVRDTIVRGSRTIVVPAGGFAIATS